MHSTLAIILVCVCLAGLLMMQMYLRKRRKHISQLVPRTRSTAMYEDLKKVMRQLTTFTFSEILIRNNGILFRTREPVTQTVSYRFLEHGFEPLDDARTAALAQAIAYDIPGLQNKREYRFDQRKRNGQTYYAYTQLHTK